MFLEDPIETRGPGATHFAPPGVIPEENRSRIFQRSFSTKGTAGRGLGTYAMKLFGEGVLHGQVGFDTGPQGTTFWIRLAR